MAAMVHDHRADVQTIEGNTIRDESKCKMCATASALENCFQLMDFHSHLPFLCLLEGKLFPKYLDHDNTTRN